VGTATVYQQWLDGTLEIPEENVLVEAPTDPQITALPTDNECIQAVAAGRTFDGIVANINALQEAEQAGQPIKVITEEPVLIVEVAFALDKGGPDTASMLELLNIIVAEMHADGTLTELSMEHLEKDVTKQPE
jgi:ABC-type amino acid transport substrate-binding protein